MGSYVTHEISARTIAVKVVHFNVHVLLQGQLTMLYMVTPPYIYVHHNPKLIFIIPLFFKCCIHSTVHDSID